MSSETREEKIMRRRENSQRHYYAHRDELRKKSRQRYIKKMEDMGLEPRPRGRPKKIKTIGEYELTQKQRKKIYYYLDIVQNQDELPDIQELGEDEMKFLVWAMIRELNRIRSDQESF
jgi:hypothetical protein